MRVEVEEKEEDGGGGALCPGRRSVPRRLRFGATVRSPETRGVFPLARTVAPPLRAVALGVRPGQSAWGTHQEVLLVNHRSPYLHERLEAYAAAVEFYRVVKTIRARLPRGLGPLGDQLSRAAQSICLNIAEGAAARSRDVKRRHWDIAAGSESESAAALDLLEIENAAPEDVLARARERLRVATLCTIGLMR